MQGIAVQISQQASDRFSKLLPLVRTGRLTALEHRRLVIPVIQEVYGSSRAWAAGVYIRLGHRLLTADDDLRDQLFPPVQH